MSTVDEIVEAIDRLSPDEAKALRQRLADRDWAIWDRQIEADFAAGRLDQLLANVDREIDAGNHTKL